MKWISANPRFSAHSVITERCRDVGVAEETLLNWQRFLERTQAGFVGNKATFNLVDLG